MEKINATDYVYDSGIPHFGQIILQEISKNGTTLQLAVPEFGANTMGLEGMILDLANKAATLAFESGETLSEISAVQYN